MMSLHLSTMELLRTNPYSILASLFFGYILLRRLKHAGNSNPKALPLPPGPKGYPLIGNLFDMPVNKPWLVYDDWCKTYGDMVYFNVFGQHFLVLGSVQRTTDLFGKRSSNYSDRVQAPMLELMGCGFNFALMPYGVRWRQHRELFHQHFHVNAVHKYLPIQRREVHLFLRRLLATPDNFLYHIRHTFASIIMNITYGIDIQEFDDPYISLAEEVLNGINEAAILGRFWVDLFPILKHVPSWFPGAGFQKKAAHWRRVNAATIEKAFRFVEAEQLKNTKAGSSVTAALIDRLPHRDDPQRPMAERLAQEVAAVAYLGGADTTTSTVQAIFLAMALYPEVQKKAQAELDAVVGPNRLPDFEDRPFLPYINAVVKESMRWHLVLPLAIPHMATHDDEYNGYYIPKGTLVLGHAWSILHDPNIFNEPLEYQPERFLKDGKLNPDMIDPDSVAFGFGRRICPGKHLSDNSLYCIVSCLLAVYDIKPPVDDQGNIIMLKPEFNNGLLSYPTPFKCIIKPRTLATEALIRDSVNEDS